MHLFLGSFPTSHPATGSLGGSERPKPIRLLGYIDFFLHSDNLLGVSVDRTSGDGSVSGDSTTSDILSKVELELLDDAKRKWALLTNQSDDQFSNSLNSEPQVSQNCSTPLNVNATQEPTTVIEPASQGSLLLLFLTCL